MKYPSMASFTRKRWVMILMGFVGAILLFGYVIPMLYKGKTMETATTNGTTATTNPPTDQTQKPGGFARFWSGPVRY
jgi:hypothetical protein